MAPARVDIPTLAAGQGASAKTGQISEFALPSPISAPSGIAAGADGNLWVAQTGANAIARVTPAGVITEFLLQGGELPSAAYVPTAGSGVYRLRARLRHASAPSASSPVVSVTVL